MKINCGPLVRKMRKEMKLSQEKLGEKLFISARQVSRIETARLRLICGSL